MAAGWTFTTTLSRLTLARAETLNALFTGIETGFASVESAKLSLTGGTMSGAIAMGSNKITGLDTPTADADAATKAYVDTTVDAAVVGTGPFSAIDVNGGTIDGTTIGGSVPAAATFTTVDVSDLPTTLTNLGLDDAASITGVETLTNKTLTAPTINNPLGIFLSGHLHGLTTGNNVTDATNDIDIAAGAAASDGASPQLMTLSSAITKRLDAAWAVGTNQGGLDTGSVADGTYHIWLIRRSDTGVVDALFSTSASSPTMPASYDQKRRIASIIRASGAILPYVQVGDEFLWSVIQTDLNASTLGTSETSISLAVPAGIKVIAKIYTYFFKSATGVVGLIYSPDIATQTPSTAKNNLGLASGATDSTALVSHEIRTNTSSQVNAIASAAGCTLTLNTTGFIDLRGRFA